MWAERKERARATRRRQRRGRRGHRRRAEAESKEKTGAGFRKLNSCVAEALSRFSLCAFRLWTRSRGSAHAQRSNLPARMWAPRWSQVSSFLSYEFLQCVTPNFPGQLFQHSTGFACPSVNGEQSVRRFLHRGSFKTRCPSSPHSFFYSTNICKKGEMSFWCLGNFDYWSFLKLSMSSVRTTTPRQSETLTKLHFVV